MDIFHDAIEVEGKTYMQIRAAYKFLDCLLIKFFVIMINEYGLIMKFLRR